MQRLIDTLRCRRSTLAGAMIALCCVLLSAGGAASEPLKRKILAIYDEAVEHSSSDTMVHARAEMPLNHMGYVVEYRDVKALPDMAEVDAYAAVVTWFTYDVTRPAEYLSWARRVSAKGIPFVIFGHVGVPLSEGNLSSLNKLLRPLGIAMTSNFVEATRGTRIIRQDEKVVGFERPLGGVLPGYPVIRLLSPSAEVALELEAPARERSVRSVVVVAGAAGALVPGQFALYLDPTLQRTQWLVDPFEIFGRVLGRDGHPIPDTTTVSGRRMFFSHVDGEGWNDSVSIDRYRSPPASAAQVFNWEIVGMYPDLPMTVGLITADLSTAFGDREVAIKTARMIFAQSHVEVASHTATSPLEWKFYEKYDAQAERRLFGVDRLEAVKPTWLGVFGAALGVTQASSDIERFRAQHLSGSRQVPRAYLEGEFSLDSEVGGAVAASAALAPAGKPVALYTWSGDNLPFAAAIRAVNAAGLGNINGGGSRLDEDYPSIGYVTPIGREVGGERQIYAVDADDASYGVDAQGVSGFPKLSATIDATETPRRLKAFGLHYHVYSVKTQSSLRAVKNLLERARSQEFTAIKTSEYVAAAQGFFTARIERQGKDTWSISNRGGLQTIRFDEPDPSLRLDIAKSDGVLGSRSYEGSLYVALDPAVPVATIALAPAAEVSFAPSLEQSSWQLTGLTRKACAANYRAAGFGEGSFVWNGLEAGTYKVEAHRNGELIWRIDANVAADNKLEFLFPGSGAAPLDFSIACARTG